MTPSAQRAPGPHIVICGAGMSGLSAALTAIEQGARVTVLEKGPRAGGSVLLSGGKIWTFADFDALRRDLPDGDAALQQLVLDNVESGRQWLKAQGVELGPFEAITRHGGGQQFAPQETIDLLVRRLEALGGVLRLETSLEDVLVRSGRVVGVRLSAADSAADIEADGVILATGGFQGNPELLSRYVVRDPHLQLRSNAWSTGDGLIAAERIGAALTSGMSHFYGHALVALPPSVRKDSFRDFTAYYGQHAVALNRLGARFADESAGAGDEVINQRLAEQPQCDGFYIFDQVIADMEALPGNVIRVAVARAVAAGASVARAETLAKVCEGLEQYGLPPGPALRTLNEFNAVILSGETGGLLPARSRNRFPLTTAPYYGVHVRAAITFTMGGLRVDESMSVLRRSTSISPMADVVKNVNEYRATPIPGLWAAGCDVGNIHHLGYMGGLATALTTGRIAGAAAAAGSEG